MAATYLILTYNARHYTKYILQVFYFSLYSYFNCLR